MNEAYVSFEVAKLLREKGFDWDTDKVYERNLMACRYEDYPMPTQQMACRWLREVHNIHIMPTIGCDVDRTPRIFYGVVIALFNDYGNIDYRTIDGNEYDEPEDAVEAALLYVLKNLI